MIVFTSFKLNINTHWCSFLKQENCSKPSGKTLPVWNINNLRLLCRRREKQFVTSAGQQDSGICCCLLLRRALVLLLFFYSDELVSMGYFLYETQKLLHMNEPLELITAGCCFIFIVWTLVPWRPSSHPALGRKENSHISQTIFSPLPRNWTP